MNRSQLEKHIGRNVEIKLFDGEVIQGYLRKTGGEELKNDPNLYIPKSLYFLTHRKSNVCRTCLFRVSHIKSLRVLQESEG